MNLDGRTTEDDVIGLGVKLQKAEKERDEIQGRLEECERAAEDHLRAEIVAWLRARAKVWREADRDATDNILVADALVGAANSIEYNMMEP